LIRHPEQLKFVSAGVTRWLCTRCGTQWDDTDPQIRRQERTTSVVDVSRPSPPIIQTVKSTKKDQLRGSLHDRTSEALAKTEIPDAGDLDHLTGFELKREEVKRFSVRASNYQIW
jgi:hypothetical protein